MSVAASRLERGAAPETAPALELVDLEVAYRVRGVWRRVLRGVNLTVGQTRVR